jgi:hypothetical protein
MKHSKLVLPFFSGPVFEWWIKNTFQKNDKLFFLFQSDTLRRWSVLYCLSRWSTDPIVFSLFILFLIHEEESDELHDLRDAISEMAWSLVVHSTMKLRCFSGTILALLAESSGKQLVATYIIIVRFQFKIRSIIGIFLWNLLKM